MNVRTLTLLAFIAASSLLPVWVHADEVSSSSPPELTSYYFVLLRSGPEWTAEKTPATEKIQTAHLANITKLHEAGKLVLAGPFTDDGNWRGIFIFKTSSIEETKSLVEKRPGRASRTPYLRDPSVGDKKRNVAVAWRLVIELLKPPRVDFSTPASL